MKWYERLLTWIIALLLSFGLGFVTCWLVKPVPKSINLTEQQKKLIIQESRLGYITLDSAKILIQQESKIKWIVKDSLIIKDSLNIKDSIITVYIPVYEAEDSLIVLLDSLNYLIEVGLKQRFLPLQEKFASSLWLNKFQVPEIKLQEDGFFKNRFVLYFGYGLSGDSKGIKPNFQLGGGLRIW